jgi:hypothetical protein
MTSFGHTITRRTFLKISAQLSLLIAGFPCSQAFAEQQNRLEQVGYGIGNYGSGAYPGYGVYLPLISKEEN